MQTVVALPRDYRDCAEFLSSQHAKEKANNRQTMLKLLSNICYIARQSLPLQGDVEEDDSNYSQLLRLRGTDGARVLDWIKRKSDKYTSPEVQNEMLEILGKMVLRRTVADILSALFYAIMVDETTNCML